MIVRFFTMCHPGRLSLSALKIISQKSFFASCFLVAGIIVIDTYVEVVVSLYCVSPGAGKLHT